LTSPQGLKHVGAHKETLGAAVGVLLYAQGMSFDGFGPIVVD
jgi:hypothetical protein